MTISGYIKHSLGFYRGFAFLSTLVGLCGCLLSWEYGFSIFIGVFWLKVITLAFTVWFINSNRPSMFFYYFNLGLTRTFLWSATLSFDFILYFTAIIISDKIR